MLSVSKEVGTLRQLGCWLRSSHSFKECVIAHQSSFLAPIIIGAKHTAEAVDFDLIKVLGERSIRAEGVL